MNLFLNEKSRISLWVESLTRIYINNINYSELGKASWHAPQRPEESALESYFHKGIRKTKLMPGKGARGTAY